MPLTASGARAFLDGGWSYLSLHTGDIPTFSNELSGGGYARVPLIWSMSADGVNPNAAPAFGPATSDWLGVFSLAVRGGTEEDSGIHAYVSLASEISTSSGSRPVIPQSLLELGLMTGGGALRSAGFLSVYGHGLVRGTYLALHTASPTESAPSEAASPGYARQALPDSAPYAFDLSDAPEAAYELVRRLRYGPSTGTLVGGETITHAAFWSASTGGTLLYSFALGGSVEWPGTGAMLSFEPGSVVVDFTADTYVEIPERPVRPGPGVQQGSVSVTAGTGAQAVSFPTAWTGSGVPSVVVSADSAEGLASMVVSGVSNTGFNIGRHATAAYTAYWIAAKSDPG